MLCDTKYEKHPPFKITVKIQKHPKFVEETNVKEATHFQFSHQIKRLMFP